VAATLPLVHTLEGCLVRFGSFANRDGPAAADPAMLAMPLKSGSKIGGLVFAAMSVAETSEIVAPGNDD
jgi:hypothetical protein